MKPVSEASALVGLAIDSMAIPVAHCHDKDQNVMMSHIVDEAEPGCSQLYVVVVGGSR